MLGVRFANKPDPRIKILCLGAHCDDIEIGCGGSLLSILTTHPQTEVHWVVFSSDRHRRKEAQSSANLFLEGAGKKTVAIESFRNGFFPYVGGEIKDYFEALKTEFSPDVIFTHYRGDLHQDHRMISELTWNTYRNHLILEYEIPKYDGDVGRPNVYVPLDELLCAKKVDIILKSFKSQEHKHWFTSDLVYSFLRIRGVETGSVGRYAEGFYCRKMVLL